MNQRLLPTGYLLTGYLLAGFLWVGFLWVGFLWVGIFATPADGTQSAKPNIVLIVADDLGYREIGSSSQQRIRTPQLDRRLILQGVGSSSIPLDGRLSTL